MDDERLPKRLLYGDVAMGSRRQGDQVRRHKDTLKTSLKQLQIDPATCEDLARNRPAWRRTVKTGVAIYEAKRIATAKAKRAARKSPAPRTNTSEQDVCTAVDLNNERSRRAQCAGHLAG
ncbi:unnamed protein product [Schistocephalus solidus]|uniref:Transposase n=1 Tax=Schistocephalus solidus TaxID=70667 RepID=A0A183TES6_SCHSO|nr:unnamed protein product [Schistocephalus solidus]